MTPRSTEQEAVTCDYCGGEHLAYELRSDKGPVVRCIPCLAIEQGGGQFSKPFESFIDNQKHEDSPVFDDREHWDEHRRIQYEAARDWYRVLSRIVQDDPIVKRDPDAIGTINEHTRTFLTNIMGSDAHHKPSTVAKQDVQVAQTTFEDLGDDDE